MIMLVQELRRGVQELSMLLDKSMNRDKEHLHLFLIKVQSSIKEDNK